MAASRLPSPTFLMVGNGAEQGSVAVDSRQIAHAAIAHFLRQQGYEETLQSFQQDAAKAGWKWEQGEEGGGEEGKEVSLEKLIELHQANLALKRRNRALAHRIASKLPTDITLAGPSTIEFKVTRTHSNLHNSNILSLSLVTLPTHSFSTTEARYIVQERRLLCSTAADKRIVLSEAESGEMIEVLEPGSGSNTDERHSAAVLWTAQNPNKAHQREFVSCGMDGKVVVWDLLHRKPIQVLRNHAKFVVKCAFSPAGDYLASCSYDKTICIYRRRGAEAANAREEVDESEAGEKAPLLDTRYELVHTATTANNPESIVFVRSRLGPSKRDPGLGEESVLLARRPPARSDEVEVEPDDVGTKRTWLAYTTRSDSCIHYIALPIEADSSLAGGDTLVAPLTTTLGRTQIGNGDEVTPDWTVLHFNTNENRDDYHVSYSLMHLTLHPTQEHICIQTGDHSIPTTGYAPSSSSLSRILILPLLSSLRSTTLWTGIESSGFATIRHDWLPDGSAAWLTSEEGLVRLIDAKGKIRAKVAAHGGLASQGEDEMTRAATWTRGGNSLIKSLVVLDERGSVATCGYDRTVRILSPCNEL